MGALDEGRRSRAGDAVVAIFRTSIAENVKLLRECRCRKGEDGEEEVIVETGTPVLGQVVPVGVCRC